MKTHDVVKLLNPGPVTLSTRVREALRGPDLCHREPEFATLQTEIRTRLAQVYPEAERDFVAVLLTGSGTAAVEAMVGSLVPARGQALVVANGVYGERMAAMLELQGKVVYVAAAPWTEPINLAAAEKILVEHEQISHVLAAQASKFQPAKSICSPPKLETASSSNAFPYLRQSAPSASRSLSRPVVVS